MLMSAPSTPIRSPLCKSSGLRPGAVLVSLLRSVAFFFGLRRPAQSRCSATCRRCEEINLRSRSLAGLGLAEAGAVVDPSRPETASLVSEGVKVVIPRRFVRTRVVSAYPLPVHFVTPVRCPQDTTTESPDADSFWPETDNAKRG